MILLVYIANVFVVCSVQCSFEKHSLWLSSFLYSPLFFRTWTMKTPSSSSSLRWICYLWRKRKGTLTRMKYASRMDGIRLRSVQNPKVTISKTNSSSTSNESTSPSKKKKKFRKKTTHMLSPTQKKIRSSIHCPTPRNHTRWETISEVCKHRRSF